MANRFQKLLDSATDQTLVEPNWEGILECVDMIRGGEVPVKEALKHIQKRYHNPNPHIAHHALLVLEVCSKNCGKKFLTEIATKECMEDLKNLVISNPQENVRSKILELIQCWTSAFKDIPEYKIVGDTHSLLKMNGFEFPPIRESKEMFWAESAPDWVEGDNCYRCRVEFGVFTRKHHCRACGQIFCDRCSNKQQLLPQFGIEKKVRVCEACFDKNQEKLLSKNSDKTGEDAREKALKEAQAKEQEEFELALAISQSEAEAKEQERLRSLYRQYNGANTTKDSGNGNQTGYDTLLKSDPIQQNTPISNVREEVALSGMADESHSQDQPYDSVLAKYLDRDYWERKRRETEEQQLRATAPPPSEISISFSSSVSQVHQNGNGVAGKNIPANDYAPNDTYAMDLAQMEDGETLLQPAKQQIDEIARNYAKMNLAGIGVAAKDASKSGLEGEEEVAETSEFCRLLKERVDTMNNRMRSNQLRGRSIVNDSAIHSLFSQLTDLHAAVLQRMTKLEEQREHYERLQDHLAHIQEARQAINALREENERQRQQRIREEQNRRQAMLKQKLEVMRHKKHEMLMTERYAAIQRFQEQERQIRQQRVVQQQSPLTVGTMATIPQMSTGIPPMNMNMPIPTPVTSHQLPMAQHNQPLQIPTQMMPTTPQQQFPHQIQQQQASVPSTQYQMPSQQQLDFGPIPPQMAAGYPPSGTPMAVPYSMPAAPAAMHTQHPPYVSSPQMMYAAYNQQMHHQMPMAGHPPPHMPTPLHPQYSMPPYQQFMPMQPAQAHQAMTQSNQHQQAEQRQEEQQKGATTEVPEDLLISFD